MADQEDKMLTVHCSLVSGELFSIDKFMQFDVQCELHCYINGLVGLFSSLYVTNNVCSL